MRLFVSAKISPAAVTELAKCIDMLKLSCSDTKWSDADKLHITLKFLGETPEEHLTKIKALLKKAAERSQQFRCDITGVGQFPKRGAPKVIWAGIEEKSGRLYKLAGNIEEALVKVNILGDGNAFSPHITIGRVRKEENIAELKKLMALAGNFRVTEQVLKFYLIKSTLTSDGPIHEDLAEFTLQ